MFGLYALVVAIWGVDYRYTDGGASYLSPFFSPDVESLFGVDLPFSPALLVLWAPLGLRPLVTTTARPTTARSSSRRRPARSPGRKGYSGESRLPLILQNAHRYFLYFAIVVLGFLWYDAVRAFFFRTGDGSLELGVGLGSLVLLANVICLSSFTFGCNSARHLIGGKLDCFTCSRSAARAAQGLARGRRGSTSATRSGPGSASPSVAFADLYIRLAASGVFHDPRIF